MNVTRQQPSSQFIGAMLLLSVMLTGPVQSWSPPASTTRSQTHARARQLQAQINNRDGVDFDVDFNVDVDVVVSNEQTQSRRALFQNAASVAVAVLATNLVVGRPAVASAAPAAADLERLRKGHARVQYLLQNWDDITQVCKNNSDQAVKQVVRTDGGDKCEKTPLNVQIYMGYKSTEDPLYKADKLMLRVAPLIKEEFDQADYLEAVENFREKADNTAMMAYTSSWGEANPNGGKDVIDDYLEKTRLDVVSSEQSLRLILKYLGLEPLPASKNP